jgi:ATP-dependent protease Clp ATPase subunit
MPEPSRLREQHDARCTFCQKDISETGALAEGPNRVYICYVCVELCAAIIEQQCESAGIPVKRWGDAE